MYGIEIRLLKTLDQTTARYYYSTRKIGEDHIRTMSFIERKGKEMSQGSMSSMRLGCSIDVLYQMYERN